jgi:hypothetical protein
MGKWVYVYRSVAYLSYYFFISLEVLAITTKHKFVAKVWLRCIRNARRTH